MGAGNYTKEEKEFYESIMKEIKKHQDFGKRNPVDIGIECGYSEDDVMGMIYICQDIIASEPAEVPVIDNWDLEGIIPFEDFMKTNFPSEEECGAHKLSSLFWITCGKLDKNEITMRMALSEINAIKREKKIPYDGFISKILHREFIISGFKDLVSWMTVYGLVFSKFELKNDVSLPIPEEHIDAIRKLIAEEKKEGFHPINKMILDANGWNKEIGSTTDKHERENPVRIFEKIGQNICTRAFKTE